MDPNGGSLSPGEAVNNHPGWRWHWALVTSCRATMRRPFTGSQLGAQDRAELWDMATKKAELRQAHLSMMGVPTGCNN